MKPSEQWGISIFCNADALVFGKRLLPLSAAHLLCLRALDVSKSVDATLEEIAITVCVCSKTYEQIRKDIFSNPEKGKSEIEAIGKRINAFDVSNERDKLFQYLENASICPEHWEPVNKSKSGRVRAPWELHIVHLLCAEYNMLFDEAMDFPISRGRALWDVARELEGADSLMTDEEYDAANIGREHGDIQS